MVTIQRRRGALHRRLLGLWTDCRRKVGHLVVHPAQPLGPRCPVYMPADREVLNAARDRRQHWELSTAAMPSALLGELCEATAVSCRSILEAEDGLAGWRYRIPPWTAMAGPAPSAGGGQFWLVLAGDAAVDGGDPLSASSCIFVVPEDPAFAGASGPVGAELLCLQFRCPQDCIRSGKDTKPGRDCA